MAIALGPEGAISLVAEDMGLKSIEDAEAGNGAVFELEASSLRDALGLMLGIKTSIGAFLSESEDVGCEMLLESGDGDQGFTGIVKGVLRGFLRARAI